MPKTYKRELTNEVFSRLTVVQWDKDRSFNHKKHHFWLCKCSCDNKGLKSVRQDHLLSGKITSCGCYQKEVMGEMSHKENLYKYINDDVVEFISSNTNSKFYINAIDFNKIINHSWYEDEKGYLNSRINNKIQRLHRHILNITNPSIQIDHKDRDAKNNLRKNLRVATPQQNSFNHGTPKNNKSGFRGVFYREEKGKWQAKISKLFLKYCDSYEEAVQERIDAEAKYFGEFKPD